ncbi:MAG: HAMP domain-containing protein [Gemmatimonadetes bacterium]|nr:HAMP domain-containing protein [Gemmatimonadota bacterium]
MKLRTRLNLSVLLLFALLAVVVCFVTIRWVGHLAFRGATDRVQLNINSAWLVYDHQRQTIERSAIALARQIDPDIAAGDLLPELAARRREADLHIVSLIDTQGRVLLRTTPPYHIGDDLRGDPLVAQALTGSVAVSGTVLLDSDRLTIEGGELSAVCVEGGGEPTGMLVSAMAPVRVEGRIVAWVQTGALLNGHTGLVDRIRDLVFQQQTYTGKPLGTATVFMGDLRITTNVTLDSGERAIGTRVSNEVAERVLERGLAWTGRAWVVDAWYLSQYDPIRDPAGKIIGMLYLGELEQKYVDLRSEAITSYLTVILAVSAVGLALAFFFSRGVLHPVRRLVEGTHRIAAGDLEHRLPPQTKGDELGDLTDDFNTMAHKLQGHHEELVRTNNELRTTNHNYMEMLGFVSHELRNPLASSVMSLNTVREGFLGPLTEGQEEMLGRVDRNLRYFLEMIGNYLDLSRLEKGEISLTVTHLDLRADVVSPVADGLAGEMAGRDMTYVDEVPARFGVDVDGNLLRIVCDNLLANAVKYGRDGATITTHAEAAEERGVGGYLLQVTNEGDGIPADKLALLFRKFGRLDDPRYRGTKGTGLGLYVCREIVEKHGGRIWAESEDGAWARFSLWLPQPPAAL